MAYRPFCTVQRRGSTRETLAWAALFCAACSVFPDEATLPDGSGGISSGGTEGSRGGAPMSGAGAGATGGNGNGGTTTGGTTTGGKGNGGKTSGGAGGAGSGAGGSAAGEPEIAGAGGSPESGGAGGNGGEPTRGGAGGAPEGGSGGEAGTPQAGQPGQGGMPGCSTPIVQTLPASVDAYITNAGNDDRTNFGDGELLLVSGVAMAEAHALIDFNLMPLTGQKIVRAKLRVVLATSLMGERTFTLYRVGRPWMEDKVTWVRASTAPTVNWTVEGGDIALVQSAVRTIADAPAGTALEFDVDADLQAFSASGESNGFLLKVADGQGVAELTSSEGLFPENRPQLVLELCP